MAKREGNPKTVEAGPIEALAPFVERQVGRCGGHPVMEGTRTRTSMVYDFAKSGTPRKTLASWWGVPVKAIDAAIEFETKRRAKKKR